MGLTMIKNPKTLLNDGNGTKIVCRFLADAGRHRWQSRQIPHAFDVPWEYPVARVEGWILGVM